MCKFLLRKVTEVSDQAKKNALNFEAYFFCFNKDNLTLSHLSLFIYLCYALREILSYRRYQTSQRFVFIKIPNVRKIDPQLVYLMATCGTITISWNIFRIKHNIKKVINVAV